MLWMTRKKKDAKHVKNNACKRISIDREAVEKLSRRQEIFRSIHLAVERCRDCDKNQLKIPIEKSGVERCQGAIEIA